MLENVSEKKDAEKKKIRLSNIEILRFISILLVVLHHVAIHTNWTTGMSTNFELIRDTMILSGKVGVDLFVIISGYLMINSRTKITSLVRTVSEAIVFSVGMYAVAIILRINGTIFSTSYFLKRLFPVIFSDYWFVTAFVFMYILLPILLPFLSSLSKKDYQRFLIIGFLVVSIWPMIALNKGMNFSYVILFLYLFAIGGYIRKFDVKIRKRTAIISIIGLTVATVLTTHILRQLLDIRHNSFYQLFTFLNWTSVTSWRENIIIWFDASPFPLLIATLIFVAVISMKHYYNNIVNFLGGHVFGAYLFQSAPIFSPWIYVTVVNLNRVHGTLNRLLFSLGVALLFVFIGIVLHVMLGPISNKLTDFLLKVIKVTGNKWIELSAYHTRSEFSKSLGLIILKMIAILTTAIFVVPGNKILGIVAISIILFVMLQPYREKNKTKITYIEWISGFVGGVLYIITFLPNNYFNTLFIIHGGVVLIAFVTVSFSIATVLSQFKNNQNLVSKSRSFHKIYWRYVLFYGVIITIYFFAYYPGILVVDSVNQWNQIHNTYPWNNWHPVGHTAVLWLTSKVWDNPASFVLLQSMIYTILFSYFATLLNQYVLKKWIRHLFFILTAVIPFFPLQAMVIVKDTLFTYAFIFLGLALFQAVRTRGKWLHNPLAFVLTLIATIGVSIWRSNGMPIVLVMLVLIILILGIKNYWRLLVIMMVSVGCYFAINGPIVTKFNIFEPSKTESYGMLIQVDAGIIHNDGVLNDKQKQYFGKLMSAQNIAGYQPDNIDKVKFGMGFNSSLLTKDTTKFQRESISLIENNKKLALKAYKAQTAVIWNQNAQYRLGILMRDKYPVETGYFLSRSDIEKYHIKYQAFNYDRYWSGFRQLHTILRNFQEVFIVQSVQHWFLPGIYLMMQLTIAFWLLLRGQWHKLLVILPIIGLAGTYMLAIPAADIRYLQPILLYVFITILVVSLPDTVFHGLHMKRSARKM